jgi:DNA polymerase
MRTLAIDIETYSSIDIQKSGVYRYALAPDFEILLFGYSIDHGPAQLIDLASGERLPENILIGLTSPYVLKTAYNVNFERTCIRQHFKTSLPLEQWECSMAKASMLGLPLSLDAAAKALKLSAEKSAGGKALIKYFSMPCKPSKVNGGRTRNLPEHAPEKWEEFKRYCVQDVVVEQAIREKIQFFQIPEKEKQLWQVDQMINDRGILLDPAFVRNAIQMDLTYRERLNTEAIALTGLSNPNSAVQLKQWLTDEMETSVDSLKKTDIPELLKTVEAPAIKRVLNIRQEMSKTSVKKYVAMQKAICPDNRVRGLLQYYGANRTGRWAGRLVQVQNLPRNEMKDLDLARRLVKEGDLEMLDLLFSVPDTLSQLIRTAFVAAPGHRLLVSDFSAIEAVVLSWLASEKWRLEVFRTHGKIYEASASHMFKIPIEKITKGSDYRQRGKVSELALGYGGGPNALIQMGALRMGLQEEELPKLVKMWRNANKAICKYWDTVENAVIDTVETGLANTIQPLIGTYMHKGILFIRLPSGRCLSYLRPQLRPNKFGGMSLCYEGLNQTTKQWGRQDTYGGKLVENIVQAVARDLLGEAIVRLHIAGYNIVMHVHDEIVAEMPEGNGSIQDMNRIMGQEVSWAKGIPLKAEGYETLYYKKD